MSRKPCLISAKSKNFARFLSLVSALGTVGVVAARLADLIRLNSVIVSCRAPAYGSIYD